MSDLDVLHDITGRLQPPDYDDLVAVARKRRRRFALGVAAAAVVVAVLGIVAVTTDGVRAGDRIDPIKPAPTSTDAPSTDEQWPLERIRAAGEVGVTDVTASGVSYREYVVCDSPPNPEPHSGCKRDSRSRAQWQHVALEVTQHGQSALFGLSPNEMFSVQEFDADSVLVLDDPTGQDDLNRSSRYRLLRADGSEVELRVLDVVRPADLAPAVPGPRLFVVDYAQDSPDALQDVYLVNLSERTLRLVDVPRLQSDGRFAQHVVPTGYDVRQWGPNVDQFLWFADRNCTVQWAREDGTFTTSEPGCADGWDPPTYIHDDIFPEGWLQPGRLALLERNDHQLFVHVSLDYGDTWQRIPVNGENAVPDALRQLG